MSLINEALKRAKRAQPSGASAEGPELQPTEPASRLGDTPSLLLSILFAVVLVLACLLLWQWYRTADVVQVRGKTGSEPARPRPATLPATRPPAVAPAPVPVPSVAPSGSNAIANPAPPAPDVVTATNTAVDEASLPQTPTYKLQGIFWRPKNPSAVINRKTVFVGDRVGDARVTAIEPDAVTIVTSAGQTNLLELP